MADPIFLGYKDGATISQKEKFVSIIVLVEKKNVRWRTLYFYNIKMEQQ